MRKLIVGISGASGTLMGARLLQQLDTMEDVETHLVISEAAQRTLELETDLDIEVLKSYADFVYDNRDMAASISSGSFRTDGMVVVPCSMKTLSGIANGYDENLIIRAADVCFKEGRKVVLVPRETPLNAAHLRNMLAIKEEGGTILPPMLTFYNHSATLEEQVDHIVGKILMQFDIEPARFRPWEGVPS